MYTDTPILTPRLKLVLESPDEVRERLDQMAPEAMVEVSPEWLARIRAATDSDPWLHGFAMRGRTSGDPIGSIGFKGPPGDDGVVEIAYAVEPDHQGNGFATEATLAITAWALGDIRVRIVRAHTLPEKNASTRVLTKSGFKFLGEMTDPEDGQVWRWKRNSLI
jgi:ribosomal-protein-alanine N-acetyltransferase